MLVVGFSQVSGTRCFVSLSDDLLYPLVTLFLHLGHLADTLVQVIGELLLQAGLVLLELEDILLQAAVTPLQCLQLAGLE